MDLDLDRIPLGAGTWISHHKTGHQWQVSYHTKSGQKLCFSKTYGGKGRSAIHTETTAAIEVMEFLWKMHADHSAASEPAWIGSTMTVQEYSKHLNLRLKAAVAVAIG